MKKLLLVFALTVAVGTAGFIFASPADAFLPGLNLPFFGKSSSSCNTPVCCAPVCCAPVYCAPVKKCAPVKAKAAKKDDSKKADKAKKADKPAKKDKK